MLEVLIAGGGIGGLAAALAVSRAGLHARVLERAGVFGEFGAGIQLGPNVTRILQGWGLGDTLAEVAAFPEGLQVRSAGTGESLGRLALGDTFRARYGAPYVTLHRADLQALLLQAVQSTTDTHLHLGRAVQSFTQTAQHVTVQSPACPQIEGDLLVGADGVWGTVRPQLLGDGPPRRTGHLAFRALMRQADLPAGLRSQQVTAWLGPRMHVVQYPVRGGDALNVVILMQGGGDDGADAWDHSLTAADGQHLQRALGHAATPLRDLLQAVGGAQGDGWRRWALMARPPMSGPQQHAAGRIALLGDAAHPMLPYLAQGAGMAIEDAAELGRCLAHASDPALGVPVLLQRYALNRWQRNSRVQARAVRNGEIFHLDGLLRIARDASMKLMGEQLLDMPWLYGHGGR